MDGKQFYLFCNMCSMLKMISGATVDPAYQHNPWLSIHLICTALQTRRRKILWWFGLFGKCSFSDNNCIHPPATPKSSTLSFRDLSDTYTEERQPQTLQLSALTDFSSLSHFFINYETINNSTDWEQRYLHPITHSTNQKHKAGFFFFFDRKAQQLLVGAAWAVS